MKTYPYKPVSAFETPHRRGKAHLSILRLDILEPNVPQIHREIMLCAQASASRSRSPSSQPTQEKMKKKLTLFGNLYVTSPTFPSSFKILSHIWYSVAWTLAESCVANVSSVARSTEAKMCSKSIPPREGRAAKVRGVEGGRGTV